MLFVEEARSTLFKAPPTHNPRPIAHVQTQPTHPTLPTQRARVTLHMIAHSPEYL